MSVEESHAELAGRLRDRVLGSGAIPRAVREGALAVGADQPATLTAEYDVVARQIGEASYRVTDDQIAALRSVAGSDLAAFEVVMTASVGAGLRRWDAAARVIEEASNAAS
jgi:hypothetical protein